VRTAYFDVVCGAAGDMIVGALLDCGLALERLKAELAKVSLRGYTLRVEKTTRHKISATRFIVQTEELHAHRGFKDIEDIIGRSGLADRAKSQAIAVFKRLAAAEAKVHGESVERVTFHEVGMVDAIVDVCAAAVGFEILEIDEACCSPLTVSSGIIETRHGTMPLPAPATAELVSGFPIASTGIVGEILTPTGAAILTTWCKSGWPPHFVPGIVGYGAGAADFNERPNVLRLFIGTSESGPDSDEVALLETNLDRTSPEHIGYLMESLLAAGALDVYVTPVYMKKNRPGQMLSVLCRIEDEPKLASLVLSEGITLGIRRQRIERWKLPREQKMISTGYGPMAVKIAHYGGKTFYFPEYESIGRAAKETGESFETIYFEVQRLLRKEK